MKNRMQDLDFEQNVAFDKVQEYEFTRRAAQSCLLYTSPSPRDCS